MTARLPVQSKIARAEGQSTIPVSFTTGVTSGNGILVAVNAGSVAGTSPVIVGVSAQAAPASPIALVQVPSSQISWRYEPHKSIAWYYTEAVAAGAYTVTVTIGGTVGSVACVVTAIELDGTANGFEGAATANSENGLNTITVPGLPVSGVQSRADNTAFAVRGSANNDLGIADYDHTLPAGWTALQEQQDGTAGKQGQYVVYKDLGSDAQVNLAMASAQTVQYGMGASMVVVKGFTSGGGLTQKVELLHRDDTITGVGGFDVDVHLPVGIGLTGGLAGARLFAASSQSFATTVSGQSRMVITVPNAATWDRPTEVISVGQALICYLKKSDGTYAGVGPLDAELIEE